MIIGVDYASVDGNVPPNFAKARAAGASFIGLRADYGTYHDPTFARDRAAIRAAGLPLMPYLFLRYGKTVPSPEDQIGALVETIGKIDEDDFPPALDVEFPQGLPATGLTVAQAIDWTKRAWSSIVNAFGVSPIIYTSARVWTEDLANTIVEEFADSIPWLAKPWPWPVNSAAQIGNAAALAFASGKYDPTVPPIWPLRSWWFHQYQGDAVGFPGFSSTVDISRMWPMRLGEAGPRVAWLQRRCQWPVTSVFDDDLDTKIKAFQKHCGLAADGIVGPKTLARIAWLHPTRP